MKCGDWYDSYHYHFEFHISLFPPFFRLNGKRGFDQEWRKKLHKIRSFKYKWASAGSIDRTYPQSFSESGKFYGTLKPKLWQLSQ
jgi:hypothetical protein